MANNRLYIEDTETGERLMLAKSFGSGWIWWARDDGEYEDWLEYRDLLASYGNCDSSPSRLRLVTENEQPVP